MSQVDSLRNTLIRSRYTRLLRWQKEFEDFVKEVCRSNLVKELYLVGSRARGDNRLSSDFDIVAVIDDIEDPLDVAEALRSIKKTSFPLDLIVIQRKSINDPIYKEMLISARKLC